MSSTLLLSPLLSVEQCRDYVTEADLICAADYSPRRAAEYLTWRAVLNRHLGSVHSICYDSAGAPSILGSSLHIGVSHTVDLISVVVSDAHCAVDVERKDRDVARISSRFLTTEERSLCHRNEEFVALWCARECYYKLRRDPSLSMLDHIRVKSLDIAAGVVVVVDNRSESATFTILETDDHFVVYL